MSISGYGTTNYELWNRDENRKLTAGEAHPLKLNFNFKLTGLLQTEAISLSASSVDFHAVVHSNPYDERSSGVTLVYPRARAAISTLGPLTPPLSAT